MIARVWTARAAATNDITRAVVTDEAKALLAQFDREVQHFDVTLNEPGLKPGRS